jgi:hypothetical protein
MAKLGTYLPDQVAFIACGIPITGFAAGSFITVERNEDSFEFTPGAWPGSGCRSRKNNFSGRFTFTLLQSSADNLKLSALIALDEATGNGIAPTTLKDNSGTSLYAAAESWIVKPANGENGTEVTNREWIVESNLVAMGVGGN